MKLTDEQKRKHNKRQYELLCKMLWDELNLAIEGHRNGETGVAGVVKHGIIKSRKRLIDTTDHDETTAF